MPRRRYRIKRLPKRKPKQLPHPWRCPGCKRSVKLERSKRFHLERCPKTTECECCGALLKSEFGLRVGGKVGQLRVCDDCARDAEEMLLA